MGARQRGGWGGTIPTRAQQGDLYKTGTTAVPSVSVHRRRTDAGDESRQAQSTAQYPAQPPPPAPKSPIRAMAQRLPTARDSTEPASSRRLRSPTAARRAATPSPCATRTMKPPRRQIRQPQPSDDRTAPHAPARPVTSGARAPQSSPEIRGRVRRRCTADARACGCMRSA